MMCEKSCANRLPNSRAKWFLCEQSGNLSNSPPTNLDPIYLEAGTLIIMPMGIKGRFL